MEDNQSSLRGKVLRYHVLSFNGMGKDINKTYKAGVV